MFCSFNWALFKYTSTRLINTDNEASFSAHLCRVTANCSLCPLWTVLSDMFLSSAWWAETLVAERALVGFFSAVDSVVTLQFSGSSETLPALRAHVNFHTGVTFLVHFKTVQPWKSLSTNRTEVRPLVGMSHHVLLQVWGQNERFTALLTFKRLYSSVTAQMIRQAVRLRETLPTQMTRESSFGDVRRITSFFDIQRLV